MSAHHWATLAAAPDEQAVAAQREADLTGQRTYLHTHPYGSPCWPTCRWFDPKPVRPRPLAAVAALPNEAAWRELLGAVEHQARRGGVSDRTKAAMEALHQLGVVGTPKGS